MSGISTHILDTASGRPVPGIHVRLYRSDQQLGSGVTDHDGRLRSLLQQDEILETGDYRLLFDIGDYFPLGFYPEVTISFSVRDAHAHYHIPLLISPFGYTTYRGS